MKKGCLSGMQGAMGGRDCVTLYPWIQSPLINTWPQAELCQNTRASLFQSSGLEPIYPPLTHMDLGQAGPMCLKLEDVSPRHPAMSVATYGR